MVISDEIEVINIFSNISPNRQKGVVGIGDDCAILPSGVGESVVVTTDTLTEGTHFIFSKISPYQLACKALTSNISDVVAMGASPTYALLSITLGKGCDIAWVSEFARGFKELADRYGIILLGGDTTRSNLAVSISITLMGNIKNSNIKLRSGAKNGDIIFCLNSLGGSSAGLNLLLLGVDSHPLIDIHYSPLLFVEQAKWLATFKEVHAMMDISDGIAKDLLHIVDKSAIGAYINIDKLPINKLIADESLLNDIDPISLALEGGEEYSLLFTVCGEFADELMDRYRAEFGMELYPIGGISSEVKDSGIEWRKDGVKLDVDYKGYIHSTTL